MRSSQAEFEIDELKYRSLGDRAASSLREKIVRGELPPGTRLTEEGLARSMGIGRACMKEAFLILESEGLIVRRVRNKYTEVAVLEETDIREIFTLRYALEVLAAETSIRNQSLPLKEIKEQADWVGRLADSNSGIADYVEEDFAFHEIIVRASQHRRATAVWRGLTSQMRMLMYEVIRKNPDVIKVKGKVNHQALVDAFASGDMERIEDTLREHILGNLPALIGHFGNNQS